MNIADLMKDVSIAASADQVKRLADALSPELPPQLTLERRKVSALITAAARAEGSLQALISVDGILSDAAADTILQVLAKLSSSLDAVVLAVESYDIAKREESPNKGR